MSEQASGQKSHRHSNSPCKTGLSHASSECISLQPLEADFSNLRFVVMQCLRYLIVPETTQASTLESCTAAIKRSLHLVPFKHSKECMRPTTTNFGLSQYRVLKRVQNTFSESESTPQVKHMEQETQTNLIKQYKMHVRMVLVHIWVCFARESE